MKECYTCPDCGKVVPLEEAEFELEEAATMVCPVCGSKIEIAAKLLEPGAVPGTEAGEFPPTPEELPGPGEEAPEAEGEGGPGEEGPAPEAPAGPTPPEQITVKRESYEQSVKDRVDKAYKAVEAGKDPSQVIGILLSQPVMVRSPGKLKFTESMIQESSEFDALADRFNDWIGVDQPVTGAQLQAIAWALAMDFEIHDDFLAAIKEMQDEYKKEMELGEYEPTTMEPGAGAEESLGEAKTVNLAPSPSQYRHMLQIIMKHCKDKASKDWAKDEYARVKDAQSWRQSSGEEEKLPIKDLYRGRPGESRKIDEEKEVKDWEGDFATFNAKLFGAIDDLGIPIDQIEEVIQSLQEKEALKLNNDKVKIDLKKAKECFVAFLKNMPAGEEPVPEPEEAPPERAPDLGSAPPAEPPPPVAPESVREGEEENESLEDKVDMVIKKFFT